MRVVVRRLTLTACASVVLLQTSRAGAVSALDDPYALPDVPRSLTLPELTHPTFEASISTTIGAITAPSPDGARASTPSFVQRWAVEAPIGLRRWFLGAAYEYAAGQPPTLGGGPAFVGGNLELYGRTVWASRTGLAFGGGFGLFAPLAAFDHGGRVDDAAEAAASLAPWDYPFFNPGAVTPRAFVDVRDVWGNLVIQFRQTLDYAIETHDFSDRSFAATMTLYVGYLVLPQLGAGVEASETYFIDQPVADESRTHYSISPMLRLLNPHVQPALGAFVALGTPVYPNAEAAWGLRFAVTILLEPKPPPRSGP